MKATDVLAALLRRNRSALDRLVSERASDQARSELEQVESEVYEWLRAHRGELQAEAYLSATPSVMRPVGYPSQYGGLYGRATGRLAHLQREAAAIGQALGGADRALGHVAVGDDSVVIGDVRGSVGHRSVVIGATDARGNTILNTPMAVGHGAEAGPGGIAIGVRARSGGLPPVEGIDFIEELQVVRGIVGHANMPFENALIDAVQRIARSSEEITTIAQELWARHTLEDCKTALSKIGSAGLKLSPYVELIVKHLK